MEGRRDRQRAGPRRLARRLVLAAAGFAAGRGRHQVHAPTLTGLGDRAHLAAAGTGLAIHVEDVVARLETDDLREVVLVGHSSSGAVISGVAQRSADRLARLVL